MKNSENLLFYVLVPFVVFVVGVTFLRYVIFQDYIVVYEVACDPFEHVCFLGCDDEVCTNQYFYKRIYKYAPNLKMQCGEDITGCEFASECLPEDGEKCSVTYCDPTIVEDACENVEQQFGAQVFNEVNQEMVNNTKTISTLQVNNPNEI